MYKSKFPDPDKGPYELQAKVQFDIRYYFARRGGENIYDMTKETFKCVTDHESGVSYITHAQDKETKNHKESDNEIISGYLPETPGSKYCPVQSFLTYRISLDRSVPYLWQRPKMSTFPEDGKGTWYGPRWVSHNPIDQFISELARKCGLKDLKYTNHSLRVTAITTLTHDKFTNKQIMALTGHKSEASLAIYQRVNTNEKMNMGFSLCANLMNQAPLMLQNPQQMPPLPQLPLPIPKEVVKEKENVISQNALVPFTPNFNNDEDLWDSDFWPHGSNSRDATSRKSSGQIKYYNCLQANCKEIKPNHSNDV